MRSSVKTPSTIQKLGNVQFHIDILRGFSSTNKMFSAKHLYDSKGCELYDAITSLDEYYLTRAEKEILESHADKITSFFGTKEFCLVELGPGDGSKAKIIIDKLLQKNMQFQYVPIDIAKEYLEKIVETFSVSHPGVPINAIHGDYLTGLDYLYNSSSLPKAITFFGSSIGNFPTKDIWNFFHTLRCFSKPDDRLLIGFDLKKDPKLLDLAYNDREGLTRDFNLNLLHRINRELGGDLKIDNFLHHPIYNPTKNSMESYLLSTKKQQVNLESYGRSFSLEAMEPIFIECSRKFIPSEIELFGEQSGFRTLEHFSDESGNFVDTVFEPYY